MKHETLHIIITWLGRIVITTVTASVVSTFHIVNFKIFRFYNLLLSLQTTFSMVVDHEFVKSYRYITVFYSLQTLVDITENQTISLKSRFLSLYLRFVKDSTES